MKNKSTKAVTRLITTSQPEEWIEAWKRQASIMGMNLSEFVGKSCNINLPYEVLQKLPKRSRPGREAVKKSEK